MKGSAARFLGGSGLVAALALVALAGANQSPAAQACVPPSQGPNVCLTVTIGPDGASVSTAALPRFVAIDATVSNESGNVVNHTTLQIFPVDPSLSARFSFVSAPTTSAGSCSYSASALTISCDLGQVRGGAHVDVGVTLRTPTVAGLQGLTFRTLFAEGPTDQNPNPGKTDTVEVGEQIDVKNDPTTEATFVPAGTAASLTVQEEGRTDTFNLPPQDFDTFAQLEFTSTDDLPFTCPKKEVCRVGTPWLTATVPGTFDPEAEIDFFWPASQVSSKQTVKNFVLFYVATPGAPVEIISARCNAQLSVVPCVKDIALPKSGPLKGSLAATLVTDHNGHMR
jgi:hypothetical protein